LDFNLQTAFLNPKQRLEKFYHFMLSIKHLLQVFFIILLIANNASKLWLFNWLGLPLDPVRIVNNFCLFWLSFDLSFDFGLYIYRRRQELEPEQSDNLIAGLSNVYYLIIATAVLLAGLAFFDINFGAAFASVSIVASALALISKDYISNIISGMLIAFSDELSVGDQIKIGDNKGKVLDITLSRLILLDDDDDVIYVPNNTVFTSQIINYTKRQIKKTSVEFDISPALVANVKQLEATLIERLKPYHEYINEDSFYLKTVDIHQEAIQMKFQFILKEPNRELEKQIRRETIRQVVASIHQLIEQRERGIRG
jgi:small-conductance mechanosensitive channel